MKITKQQWEPKGYASLNLTARNLRDTVARYDKKQKRLEANTNPENLVVNQRQIDVCQGNGETMGYVALTQTQTIKYKTTNTVNSMELHDHMHNTDSSEPYANDTHDVDQALNGKKFMGLSFAKG